MAAVSTVWRRFRHSLLLQSCVDPRFSLVLASPPSPIPTPHPLASALEGKPFRWEKLGRDGLALNEHVLSSISLLGQPSTVGAVSSFASPLTLWGWIPEIWVADILTAGSVCLPWPSCLLMSKDCQCTAKEPSVHIRCCQTVPAVP